MIARMAPLTAAWFLFLGGVDAWLLSVLIDDSPPSEQVVTGAIGAAPNLTDVNLPPAKSLDAYRYILAQPIFLKTRAPFVAPPPAALPPSVVPPPTYTDPAFVLGGITMSRKIRKAYLFARGESQGVWVSEGEHFKGWSIQTVDSGSVKLQQQNRTIELFLYPPP